MATLKFLRAEGHHSCNVPKGLLSLRISLNSTGTLSVTFITKDGTRYIYPVMSHHEETYFDVRNVTRILFTTDTDLIQFIYAFDTVMRANTITVC